MKYYDKDWMIHRHVSEKAGIEAALDNAVDIWNSDGPIEHGDVRSVLISINIFIEHGVLCRDINGKFVGTDRLRGIRPDDEVRNTVMLYLKRFEDDYTEYLEEIE